jgi:hypothetical protein
MCAIAMSGSSTAAPRRTTDMGGELGDAAARKVNYLRRPQCGRKQMRPSAEIQRAEAPTTSISPGLGLCVLSYPVQFRVWLHFCSFGESK